MRRLPGRRFIPPLLFDTIDFRRLWLGQTISVFGDQITLLGCPWWPCSCSAPTPLRWVT